MMTLRWRSASRTDAGTVRNRNEDAVLDLWNAGIWVVADGMGGHEAGDVASRMIVEAFEEAVASAASRPRGELVRASLETANSRIHLEAQRRALSSPMGSTVVAFYVDDGVGHCLWAGDSRAYHLREGVMRQISRDHSLVEDLVSSGRLDRAEAMRHPYANVITRAVGTQDSLAYDVETCTLADGDTILLCTDGLNKELEDDEIATVLDRHGCESSSRLLVEAALARGARDNVTVAVIEFRDSA